MKYFNSIYFYRSEPANKQRIFQLMKNEINKKYHSVIMCTVHLIVSMRIGGNVDRIEVGLSSKILIVNP